MAPKPDCHLCGNDPATLICLTCESLNLSATEYCEDCSQTFHADKPKHNVVSADHRPQPTSQFGQTAAFTVEAGNDDDDNDDIAEDMAEAFDKLGNAISHPGQLVEHAVGGVQHGAQRVAHSVGHTVHAAESTVVNAGRAVERTISGAEHSVVSGVVNAERSAVRAVVATEHAVVKGVRDAEQTVVSTAVRTEHAVINGAIAVERKVVNTVVHTETAVVNTVHTVEKKLSDAEHKAANKVKHIFSNDSGDDDDTPYQHQPHESALPSYTSPPVNQQLLRSAIRHRDSKDELIDLTKKQPHKQADAGLHKFGTAARTPSAPATPIVKPQPVVVKLPVVDIPTVVPTKHHQSAPAEQRVIQRQDFLPITSKSQLNDTDSYVIPKSPYQAVQTNSSLPQMQQTASTALTRTQAIQTAAPTQPTGPLCAVCETTVATVYCQQCDLILCTANDECDQHIHAQVQHTRVSVAHYAAHLYRARLAKQLAVSRDKGICVMCDSAAATVYCQQCELNLCTQNQCDAELHVGALRQHTRTSLVTQTVEAPVEKPPQVKHDIGVATADDTVPCDICHKDAAIIQCHTCHHTACHICDIHAHMHASTHAHDRRNIFTGQRVYVVIPEPEPVQPTVQPLEPYEPLTLNVFADTHHIQPETDVLTDTEGEPVAVMETEVIETEHACDECGLDASVHCMDCKKYYCNGAIPGSNCDLDVHFATARRQHTRKHLRGVHNDDDHTHHPMTDTEAEAERRRQAEMNAAAQVKRAADAEQAKQAALRRRQQRQYAAAQAAAEQRLLTSTTKRQQQYNDMLDNFKQQLSELEAQKAITENRLADQATQRADDAAALNNANGAPGNGVLASERADLDQLSAQLTLAHRSVHAQKQQMIDAHEAEMYERAERIKEQMRRETEDKMIEIESLAASLGDSEAAERRDMVMQAHRVELQGKQDAVDRARKERELRMMRQQKRDEELHELNKQVLIEREKVRLKLATQLQPQQQQLSQTTRRRVVKKAVVLTDAELREQAVAEMRQQRAERLEAARQAATERAAAELAKPRKQTDSTDAVDAISTTQRQPVNVAAVDAATKAARLRKAKQALYARRIDTKQQAENYRSQRRATRPREAPASTTSADQEKPEYQEEFVADDVAVEVEDVVSDAESTYSDWENHLASTHGHHSTHHDQHDTVAHVIAHRLQSESDTESEDDVELIHDTVEPVNNNNDEQHRTVGTQHHAPHNDEINLAKLWPALAHTANELQQIGKTKSFTKSHKPRPLSAAQQQRLAQLSQRKPPRTASHHRGNDASADMQDRMKQRTATRRSAKPAVSRTQQLSIEDCEAQLARLKTTEQFELRKTLILQIEHKRQLLKEQLLQSDLPRTDGDYLLSRYHVRDADNAVVDAMEDTLQRYKGLQHNIQTLQLDDAVQSAPLHSRPHMAKPRVRPAGKLRKSSTQQSIPSLDDAYVLRPTHSFDGGDSIAVTQRRSLVLNHSTVPEMQALNKLFQPFTVSSLAVTQRRQPHAQPQ